jgi:hypothetical protein
MCLRRFELEPVFGLFQRLRHSQRTRLEVNIAPPQAKDLPAALWPPGVTFCATTVVRLLARGIDSVQEP